ncbi:hypothetical protein [Pseudoblastomonas halimionae]|uniref:Uncharacterized protein n=1 Tax=Alteriqipengyuania halimionae TaxID=1926630 RepID=A0A6I4U8Z0_9SPHN|nr:hypothetical protein [Alteriqipengyuania halimionae]MXP10757.1 hypothetical protein [Alteriqipengyuania halimionae]
MSKKDEPLKGWRAPTEEEYRFADEHVDERLFERGPANSAVQWGLWTLHEELAAAARFYRAADLQGQRDAVFASLFAVERYLKSQGFSEATTEPLIRPAEALVDREANRRDLLFCERKRSGAPSRTVADYNKIGAIAALAEAWLALHKDGDGKVADKLKRFIRHVEGPWLCNLTLSRVKAAREMVSQEAKDHPAVEWANRYRNWLAESARLGGPAAAIRTVARILNRPGRRETSED